MWISNFQIVPKAVGWQNLFGFTKIRKNCSHQDFCMIKMSGLKNSKIFAYQKLLITWSLVHVSCEKCGLMLYHLIYRFMYSLVYWLTLDQNLAHTRPIPAASCGLSNGWALVKYWSIQYVDRCVSRSVGNGSQYYWLTWPTLERHSTKTLSTTVSQYIDCV